MSAAYANIYVYFFPVCFGNIYFYGSQKKKTCNAIISFYFFTYSIWYAQLDFPVCFATFTSSMIDFPSGFPLRTYAIKTLNFAWLFTRIWIYSVFWTGLIINYKRRFSVSIDRFNHKNTFQGTISHLFFNRRTKKNGSVNYSELSPFIQYKR